MRVDSTDMSDIILMRAETMIDGEIVRSDDLYVILSQAVEVFVYGPSDRIFDRTDEHDIVYTTGREECLPAELKAGKTSDLIDRSAQVISIPERCLVHIGAIRALEVYFCHSD